MNILDFSLHSFCFFIFDFAKAFDTVPTQEAITQIRLLWDKQVHPQVDQLVALWVHSTSSFRWPSLGSSPSVI